MKKILILLLILLLAVPAFGAELDEYATVSGMDRSWYQGYEPTVTKHVMTIYLPLKAREERGRITVSIALDDPNVYLLSGQPNAVRVSPKNGVYPVKLTIPLKRDRRNGDYPATITIQRGETTETMPYVIRIRDGRGNPEVCQPVLEVAQSALDLGTEGSITLAVTNPTTTVSMTGGVITVTNSEVMMSGSNRVEVPEILPGKTEIISVPMHVPGNTSVSLHTFEIDFFYHTLGQAAQWQESFTLPVTQAIRLEQGGVQMPTGVAGELTSMTLPLMNMGRGDLSNVLVTLDGIVDAQSVLVGTIEPGETKQAKLTFTPHTSGTHEGAVTITCEDAYGNRASQTVTVMLKVEEPMPETVFPEEEKDISTPWTAVLALICGLLLVVLGIQSKVLTSRLHKLEEERL